MINNVLATLDQSRESAVARLFEYLRIPSVSTSPAHNGDTRRCAEFLAGHLEQIGLSAKVMPTPGHPIVVARNQHAPGRPTVLLYGHYDVQPAEPLELWHSPPFEPTIRDGAIYARGASDDKGQVWSHVEALRAWHAAGGLPLNIILLIEGEEEIGSPNLTAFIEQNRDLLKADVAVISDTSQFARGVPAICYGLRGLVYEEVFLEGPSHDLHSGLFGGAVPNPANLLCELVATLHDHEGRVNIPGFYDDVQALQSKERELWKQLPFSEEELARELGLEVLTGENGFSAIERKWARPTCDVNGITTGYQGEGAKTVIPAKASAKVSMRLVPNQDPLKIREAFANTMQERCPAGVRVTVRHHSHAEPTLVPLGSKAMQLAADALQLGFGAKPTFIREGGTIPVVAVLKKLLGLETLLIGFGLPDDRLHSPNEKFDLDGFHGGARAAAALYDKLKDLR